MGRKVSVGDLNDWQVQGCQSDAIIKRNKRISKKETLRTMRHQSIDSNEENVEPRLRLLEVNGNNNLKRSKQYFKEATYQGLYKNQFVKPTPT